MCMAKVASQCQHPSANRTIHAKSSDEKEQPHQASNFTASHPAAADVLNREVQEIHRLRWEMPISITTTITCTACRFKPWLNKGWQGQELPTPSNQNALTLKTLKTSLHVVRNMCLRQGRILHTKPKVICPSGK